MITLEKEVAETILQGESVLHYKLVEEGDWEGGGKYQHKSTIFQDLANPSEKYYAVSAVRTGSYYTDYYVEVETECPEVRQVEVVTYRWENVNQ